MKMLERTGQAANTLVMFFSDQGAPYPNGGYSHYEPGVRIPMIVVHPAGRRRGVVSDAMVTLADVTPTILDWTGVEPPAYALHGRSLLPVLEQEKTSGWDSVVLSHVMHEVTMYYPMRTFRDRRHKLIWNLCHQLPWRDASEVTRWSTWAETLRRGDKFIGRRSIQNYIWRPVVELYDLEKDPDEVVNLAEDPTFASLRRELSEKLLARLRATRDNWLERYQLPMPGEQEQISVMSPPGYSPPRPPGLDELSIVR
jgi:N-sulfoglucosamine sulfohydrolase